MKFSGLKIVCFKWKHKGGRELVSLKTVGEYEVDHVNRLYHAVERNLTIPHEFICITDDPTGIECKTLPMWDTYRELGGCYTRLFAFSEEMKQLIGDRFVMVDLDMVVVGSLDKLVSRKEDFIINQYDVRRVLPDNKQVYNGSLIMMDAGARQHVWKIFNQKTSLAIMQNQKRYIGSDQAWINYILGGNQPLFTKKDGVYRFQLLTNKKKLPENACLVSFAGNADPSKSLDIEWVKENWI
jgi:hypothetical protein